MFAVWGWGVGINGTSSVVAVSSIFSEYMDFFYFCTCSPWKRKKKISNFMCCLRKSWVAQQIPLSGRELAVDSPKRDVGTGWWLFLLCRHRPRVSACGEKQFLSPQTLHWDLTCTEQVPLSAPMVGAGPGPRHRARSSPRVSLAAGTDPRAAGRAPPHPASPAQTSHLATARSRAGENHRMFVVEALNLRHLPTGGVTPL